MPCTIAEHSHTWASTGDLVIHGCEIYCAFCKGQAATKNWRYAWFLARHVRTFHKYEHPELGEVKTTKKLRRTKVKNTQLKAIKLEAPDESLKLAEQTIEYEGKFNRVNQWLDATTGGMNGGIGIGSGNFGGFGNGMVLGMDGYGNSNGSGNGIGLGICNSYDNGCGNGNGIAFGLSDLSNGVSFDNGLSLGMNVFGDGIGGKIEHEHDGDSTALQYPNFGGGLNAGLRGGTDINGQDCFAGMCGPLAPGKMEIGGLGTIPPLASKYEDNFDFVGLLDAPMLGDMTFIMAVEPTDQATAAELLAMFQTSGELAKACHQMQPAEMLFVVRQYAEQLNLQIPI